MEQEITTSKPNFKQGSALVVGAGISGIKNALELAQLGYKVTLIDNKPNIGGILSQLDYQFPTDNCGMCKMLPSIDRESSSQYCMRKGLFHENINILLSAELAAVDGFAGDFHVKIKQKQKFVNPELCNGCGLCSDICPIEITDAFNENMAKKKAIHLPVPHMIPNAYTIDWLSCNQCGKCVDVCPTKAIDISESSDKNELELDVMTIVVSCGSTYYDPSMGDNRYGYRVYPNVITSIEFERLLSGTGPTNAKLIRPSDNKEIKKIAWLQCIGSRDIHENSDFCSSICCMYAIKEARLAKKTSDKEIETAIFYMDMRAFGKNYFEYKDIAEKQYDIRFERGRVHSIIESKVDKSIKLNFVDYNGNISHEIFDLVVLSIGQRPSASLKKIADISQIPLNDKGFIESLPFLASQSKKEGIAFTGAATGLKDISDSVVLAISASSQASLTIQKFGGKNSFEIDKVNSFNDTSHEDAKILIGLCMCNNYLSQFLNFSQIEKQLTKNSDIIEVIKFDDICSEKGWENFCDKIKNSTANRLLIGMCLPHVFNKNLNKIANLTSIDTSFIEVLDIYKHIDSGVKNQNKDIVTKKTIADLKILISKLTQNDFIARSKVDITQKALVVGGGIAGMTAALSIANHGFVVELVEKQGVLGGNLNFIDKTIEGYDVSSFLAETIQKVKNHKNININLNSEVIDSKGQVGNFITQIKENNAKNNDSNSLKTIKHGATIIATGGSQAETNEYENKKSDLILTQKEFEEKFKNGDVDTKKLSSVVMIQCVGSRQKDSRYYCSRVCCLNSIKTALTLKCKNPDIQVYILYRDIMAYGDSEKYYTQARKEGVIFLPYETEKKPKVIVTEKNVEVRVYEQLLKMEIDILADYLILASGIKPELPEELSQYFGIKTDKYGFFAEADSKWRPVDSVKEGVFACGIVLSCKNITETISTAQAASQRALTILTRKQITNNKEIVSVRHNLCSLCQRCIEACPYDARYLNDDDEKIVINHIMCQACGSCAAVCPNSAAIFLGYKDKQIFSMLDIALNI